jgi:hypothetical protein
MVYGILRAILNDFYDNEFFTTLKILHLVKIEKHSCLIRNCRGFVRDLDDNLFSNKTGRYFPPKLWVECCELQFCMVFIMLCEWGF